MPDGAMTRTRPQVSSAREQVRRRMLSAERESELVARWRDTGDPAALDTLLRAYEPLAQAHAKRFDGMGERGDLLQEARLGLLDALRRFDPAYGTRLSTYAGFWIEERLRRFTLETAPMIRIPRHTRQALSRAIAGQDTDPGGAPDAAHRATREAARRHGVDEATAAMAVQMRHPGAIVSLDQPAPTDEGESRQSPLDLLKDPALLPDQEVARRHDGAVRRQWLHQALGRLDARKATIIRRRHLAEPACTLEALAGEFGVSKERVRQLEAAALRDLRRMA
jgi:RNA polymerase sigma-32 factor